MSLPDLKTVYDRCDEVGDCQLWAQGVNGQGAPQASHEGKQTLIRRHVFALSGRELRAGWVIATTCGHALCVKAEHLEQITRSELTRRSYRNRNTQAEYATRARTAKAARLNFDIAREIRAADTTHAEEARRRGVSASLIGKIRQGHIWREGAPNSSVFNLRA